MSASQAPRDRRLPLSRRIVRVAWLLAMVLGALAGAFVAFEARELRNGQLAQVAFHARALEDQTSSVMSSTELLLRALAPPIERRDRPIEVERLSALFEDSLRGRPFLRSVSLLSMEGQVLASSNPDNLSVQLNPEQLGMGDLTDRVARLGHLRSGRDLADLGKTAIENAIALVLPMVASAEYSGQKVLLVALINPDLFATQYERMLDGTHHQATLLNLQAGVVAATSGLATGPGHTLQGLAAFTQFLPQQEFGSGIGPGAEGTKVLSAFRALRNWPLVVYVEQPYQALLDEVSRVGGWAAAFLLTGWLLLGTGTWTFRRVLLRDEELSRQLQTAHVATKASESRKLAILQSSLDGIVTVDGDGRIIDFNPAAERMFGYSAARALNQPMHELLIPSRHRVSHIAGMARYQNTGQARILNQRLEVEAQRADGSVFPVELTIVPVKTDTGELYTATLRDITDRQRVERALRDSEARARATFDQAAVGVLQQSADRRILRVNQALCKLLGYTREELLTRVETDLVHPDDLRVSAEGMQRLFAGQTSSLAQDRRLRHKNGKYIWARMTASLARDDKRQPLYLIGIVEDISVRRRAEDELAAARRRELQISTRIQKSLLVTAPPPDMDVLHISSFSQASQGIDGDFLEIIRIGKHCVDIITGDVMGKGIAAAMMGAATKMQFSRSIAELVTQSHAGAPLPSPAAIVSAVHVAMTPALQALEAFVTLCYLRIDTERHTVAWVGCGHEEPLRVSNSGQADILPNQHPPLGVLDSTVYTENEIALHPGDSLFLCSDGVTDAVRPDGERVGRQRVIDSFSRRKRLHATPAAVLHSLRGDLLPSGVKIQDDVTMVVVQHCDHSERVARIEAAVDLKAIRDVRNFITTQSERSGLSEEAGSLLAVAVVEAFTNVVRHAIGLPDQAPVELVARQRQNVLVFELIHIGEEFIPPADPPDTDFSLYPEGGFGLEIIHGASDAVEYLHQEGVNTLRMTKQLG